MTDRQVQYPNRFKLTPVSGQSNTYDLSAVPGTITRAGTPINKTTLLTDETAAALGLRPSDDPTVDAALLKAVEKATADGFHVEKNTSGNFVLKQNGSRSIDSVLVEEALLRASIITGQYEGTGNYGQSSANTITFPFAPIIVIVQTKDSSSYGPLFIRNGVQYVTNHSTSSVRTIYVTWSADGKTVSWYADNASFQMNTSNTYNYFAF